MFLESLLESSPQAKSCRGWSTLTSFIIESVAVGVLILAPLLYTEALPRLTWLSSSLIGPPAGESPRPPGEAGRHTPKPQPVIDAGDRVIRAPGHVPHGVAPAGPIEPPPDVGGECVGLCVQGGIDTGRINPAVANLLRTAPSPEPPKPAPAPLPISHIDEGMLIRRVQPVYPTLAITTHTQGTVVLHAIIGRDGVIRQVEVLSGHPLLISAALDAVRQWRYRPYYLGGQPVEVETSITVNFALSK